MSRTPRAPGIDPIEEIIRVGLTKAGHEFVDGSVNPGRTHGLDFYLPQVDLYIEVKQFHSMRIGEQMGRVKNVIAIQGKPAATEFVKMIGGSNG